MPGERSERRRGRLLGQASDSGVGFWCSRILALIASNLGIHFLPEGVIFWGAWPRRQILRRTACPRRYVVHHMASARRESSRGDHQSNQASHTRTDSMSGKISRQVPQNRSTYLRQLLHLHSFAKGALPASIREVDLRTPPSGSPDRRRGSRLRRERSAKLRADPLPPPRRQRVSVCLRPD